MELLKNKRIKFFKHKFKSKKDNKHIFFVDHRAIKNLKLFPSLLKEDSKLIMKKKDDKIYNNYVPTSDCIILKDGSKYFILFTKEKEIKKTEQQKEIISLDPGIKKFQSFYTPNGISGNIGDFRLKSKLLNIEKRIDKLQSLKDNGKKTNENLIVTKKEN